MLIKKLPSNKIQTTKLVYFDENILFYQSFDFSNKNLYKR